jgi:hypothetical protein
MEEEEEEENEEEEGNEERIDEEEGKLSPSLEILDPPLVTEDETLWSPM